MRRYRIVEDLEHHTTQHMNTDTPETDALPMTDDPMDYIAMIEHARKLERERDEAQAALEGAKAISKRIAAEMLVTVKDIERERDKAREDATNYFARVVELESERDEARRQCLQWLEEWHLTDKARRDTKAERDEARRYANNIDLCQEGVAPCDLAAKLMEKLDEAIRQRNETNESSKYAVEYARAQEDIHLQNFLKLVDLAERMLAEMEYVNWLSTAAVFRDELNQIKEENK